MKKQDEENSIQDEAKSNDSRQKVANDVENTDEYSLPDAEESENDPNVKLEIELSEARDKYLRLYSDFENYKKRIARDRIELVKMAGADIFLSILPVMDDMERAIKAMNESSNQEAVKEGLQLISAKLKSITEAKGLVAMESVGKPFDPELHDAITNIPASSENMKGMVMDEAEKGYFLNDKVLRHAKVIVGN